MSHRLPGEEWKDLAMCAGTNCAAHFPPAGEVAIARIAYRTCLRCTVRQECQDADRAEDVKSSYGIRAGLPPKARRKVKVGDPAQTDAQIMARIEGSYQKKREQPKGAA